MTRCGTVFSNPPGPAAQPSTKHASSFSILISVLSASLCFTGGQGNVDRMRQQARLATQGLLPKQHSHAGCSSKCSSLSGCFEHPKPPSVTRNSAACPEHEDVEERQGGDHVHGKAREPRLGLSGRAELGDI